MAMKWLDHLLRPKDWIRPFREPRREQSVAMNITPPGTKPPINWSDTVGWDRFFQAQSSVGRFCVPTRIGAPGWRATRFLSVVSRYGGRVWFPGCGIDQGPRFYAYLGCTVLATDFSPFAVCVQRKFAELAPEIMFTDWSSFDKSKAPFENCGQFEVAEHDFTTGPPAGVFDLVINCRAFQGLSPSAMTAAATHFFTALRPGCAAIIDTINVQGRARDVLEDCLIDAGFFLPFRASDRWYRAQLQDTGIIYGMVLGRPLIPNRGQYPADQFDECAQRDRKILESFRAEYEARLAAEEPSVKAVLDSPEAIVARVVYATG